MSGELEAYAAVDFAWTRQLKSVWTDPKYHLPGLHKQVSDDVLGYLNSRTQDADPADEPLGRVIVGPAGFGKTHLIGELRRQVWEKDGWFVLLDFIGIKEDFWASAALGFLNSLQVRNADGLTQGHRLVLRLSKLLEIEEKLVPTADRWRTQSRDLMLELVRFFKKRFAHKFPGEARQYQDVVTALVLLISDNFDCQNIAHDWLQGTVVEGDDVRELGLSQHNSALKVVQGLSWLMSRIAPTLIAIDQIDAIVTASNSRASAVNAGSAQEQQESRSIVDALAQGLMDLHEAKRRAVTVIACLEATWKVLQDRSSVPMQDRYKPPVNLNALSSLEIARGLVTARLQPTFAARAFKPPFPAWPFTDAAFESAIGFSARQLLKVCDRHQQRCVAAEAVTLCESFVDAQDAPAKEVSGSAANLTTIYDKGLKDAVIGHLWEADEGERFGELLDNALRLLEQHYDLPDNIDSEVQRDPDQRRPALHGRLSFTFLSEASREQQYCFRMLHHANARAFQTRLRAAMTASGLDMALQFRHLFILRRDAVPSGAKTEELVSQFRKGGGKFINPTDGDLRALVALTGMAARKLAGFEEWLRKEQPLFKTMLFKEAQLCPPAFLAGSAAIGGNPVAARSQPSINPAAEVPQPVLAVTAQLPGSKPTADAAAPGKEAKNGGIQSAPRVIPLGRRYERGVLGSEVGLAPDLLQRHLAILAGSGSGKTVLLRRIVEEAALLGMPSIVLDPNNDLSRLSDAWPTLPESWSAEDAAKAKRYSACTDVVIWTPGVSSGNPISLNLLPDFAAIEDVDEREQAIGMALTTLLPFLTGSGAKATRKRGVLADTVRRFAAMGGGALADLIALLAELPDDVSQDSSAAKLASEIADQLRAEIAMNPLLQSGGEPLDPKTLFQGSNGKTRISVINLAGLGNEEARDSFVNRLQMSLFTFIKRNPNPAGWLYVIDEAQNFAPSGAGTACKASTLSLAAQARKYGLGMIFATQTPKGVDNKIISNCITQVYGRMNAPATIDAIGDLMAAKGGAADDIGKLSKGEFYFSTEGSTRPYKIHTPLCLSWHPANPPTGEEVMRKARLRRP